MPLVQTRGAASAQGFGEFAQASAVPNYIEDVFSTYLYTGTGATRTITNNIDLSTKGGLVWIKNRDTIGYSNLLIDTVRGAPNASVSNLADPQTSATYGLTAFTTSGFTLGTAVASDIEYNGSNKTFASWTFRKQPKFFDIVTFTQNGGVTVSHNLGSVPACIIIKSTAVAGSWYVYHTSLNTPNGNGPRYNYLTLNSTDDSLNAGGRWIDNITSTSFDITNQVVAPFTNYVAYLFAHDAGGFGLTGTDNVVSCGSFTTNGSGFASATLGYEPQFVLFKASSTASNWEICDTMRGLPASSGAVANLKPNTSAAESVNDPSSRTLINSTGFSITTGASVTYIYIAIRRGPMKVPTLGTSVFDTQLGVSSTTATISSGFVTDAALTLSRPDGGSGYGRNIYSRLQGNFCSMNTTRTDGESTFTNSSTISFSQNNGIKLNGGSVYNADWVYEQFRRAPSFFDEVCYTGTGSARTIAHNLTVVPELLIVKTRSVGGTNRGWWTYAAPVGNADTLYLNGQDNAQTASIWNNTTPTSTVFSVDGAYLVNESGTTYVAYLFATCPGVSKVGSYTGTGTTLQINCGFTAGARFVLIKRTDSTGDWYVWDSARGIIAGNDPYLLLNSTAAEVPSTDYVDTYSAGFEISSTAPAAINSSASGATYIFLAIA